MSVEKIQKRIWKLLRTYWSEWAGNTLILILGMLLVSVCFVSTPTFDRIITGVVQSFDFRGWPWWYFVILAVIAAFSVKWYLICRKRCNDRFDESDFESVRKYITMSVTITIELLILTLLHMAALLECFYRSLWTCFKYGIYSHKALFTLFVIVFVVCLTVHVVKVWLVFVLHSE